MTFSDGELQWHIDALVGSQTAGRRQVVTIGETDSASRSGNREMCAAMET